MRAIATALILAATVTAASAWDWKSAWKEWNKPKEPCTSYCTPVSDYMPW